MKRVSFLVLMISCLIIALTFLFESETAADQYKVGVGDVIQIAVISHPELKTLMAVTSDGTITFPYLGTVSVKGKTLSQIEKDVTEKLKAGYVKYPVVSVMLMQSMSRKVYTYGQLMRLGEIPYIDNLTVIIAVSIAGVSEGGRFGKLIVKRKNGDSSAYKDIVEARLNNGFLLNKEIENMFLKPDDILIVERSDTILIEGEVARRGRFVLENDMTVLRALLEAGGVIDSGAYGKIRLRRKQEGEIGEYKDVAEANLNDRVIESREVEDMLLKPDDILIVERSETFLIQGEVFKRGRFVLENEMTVLRALLEAGVSERGSNGKIKLRRKQEGEIGEYKDVAEANLNDGVIESSEVEDMILEPDDIIVVDKNRTYFIYGEANKVGEYVLDSDMTVFKALSIAGGFTKWGSKNRVKILRTSDNDSGFEIIKVRVDKIIEGDAAADVLLKPGDTIVVSAGVF